MPKGIYAAASAMVVETRTQDVVARNLAHVQTPGYRRETASRSGFVDALQAQGNGRDPQGDGGTGVLSAGSWFDFAAEGKREMTGATYDVALHGRGFFRVRNDSGEALLTRAGHFHVDNQGRLATEEGWTVEGQGGPVSIPADARRVVFDPAGRLLVDSGQGLQVSDQLRVVSVPRPEQMRALNGQYFDPQSQTQSDAAGVDVQQGHLERANLESLDQLVEMIAAHRRYDAAQRALREQANTGGGLSDLLRGA
jgi:flagellar basal-body rod protein FlgF